MVKPGHFYTMSADKHACGDRSWMHDIWEVLASNETHALIKNACPRYADAFGTRPMVVAICQFDWTNADDLHKAAADYAIA